MKFMVDPITSLQAEALKELKEWNSINFDSLRKNKIKLLDQISELDSIQELRILCGGIDTKG